MYTGRYQVLRHRCERETPVTGVFSVSKWPGWVEYDVTTVQRGISPSEYQKGNMAHMKGNMALWRATWRSQKATWRCAMLEKARWNTGHKNMRSIGYKALWQWRHMWDFVILTGNYTFYGYCNLLSSEQRFSVTTCCTKRVHPLNMLTLVLLSPLYIAF